MPHYNQTYIQGQSMSNCYNGHCWCNCIDYQTGSSPGITPVPELTCNPSEDPYWPSSICEQQCNNWCLTYEHMYFQAENPEVWQPPQPRPARPRQPYTPGRGRRGYNKGGRVNTNSRFPGRTQTNPKGKPKK